MWKFKHLFMNTETGAEAPAGNAGGDNAGNGDGTQNPGGGTPAGTSLLSTGAGEQGADDWLPEKYRVMGDDGKLNVEGSARKLADAYSHLEKRMGSGDTPPKTADEYAPKVEVEGFKWDEFKADPRMQSFMKSAHAKGITNDQMGFILGEYAQLAPERLTVLRRWIRKPPPRSCARRGKLTPSLIKTSVWLSGHLTLWRMTATKGVWMKSAITRW